MGFWRSVSHGCPQDAEYILRGLEFGFDIDVSREKDLERTSVDNLKTTVEQKVAVSKWINEKHGSGALWGPWRSPSEFPFEVQGLRVSPVGCVKKGVHRGLGWEDKKWRVIHHLSHPRSGNSVNSEIDPEFKEVCYVKFREVVSMVKSLGIGARLWTIDAQDAYLRVPIKRECFKYMGFQWMGLFYAFTCLSFGLASACRIYTLFADLVLWIIINNTDPDWWSLNGAPIVYHYVDDFFGGAPAHSPGLATRQFEAVVEWFRKLGIPTRASKCFAPRTRLKILGFIYDTVAQMVFIPEIKLRVMLEEIDDFLSRKSVMKRELLSLIGKLRWASVCVTGGPAFVRRMEKFAAQVRYLNRNVKVSKFKRDLIWWRDQILLGARGVRFIDILRAKDKGDVHVLTDASTGIGMGGWNREGNWFRFRWTDHPNKKLFRDPKHPDIFWKEMCAIATACLLWGQKWKSKAVTFWCDNEACVYSAAKGGCSFERPDVQALIRIIAACANTYEFKPFVHVHIKGKDNLTADALSRFDLKKFHSDIQNARMDSIATDCAPALDLILSKCFN